MAAADSRGITAVSAPQAKYWAFRLGTAVVPLLPAAWLNPLAAALGSAGFVLGGRARRNALDNITPVVGSADATATARRMFVHSVRCSLTMFERRPATTGLGGHRLNGWHYFHEALAGGRGCVLVSPHLGDINYMAELFVADGLPVNVLVEELRPPALARLAARQRARRGVQVIVAGTGALREIAQALARNEIVALLSDRLVGNQPDYPVRFFGRQVRLPGTAFTLAARYHSPVVFGTAVRRPNGTIETDVRAPFVPDRQTAAYVQEMARVFEQFILRDPGCWLAFQPILGPVADAAAERASACPHTVEPASTAHVAARAREDRTPVGRPAHRRGSVVRG